MSHILTDIHGVNMSSQSTTSEIISIRNLDKVYNPEDPESRVVALEDLDLVVERGEFVSIVGPSGCGKSTLLRIISGLIERTDGTVEVEGENVTGPVTDVGFMFQAPVLMDWRTVEENVMFPYEALKSNNQVERSREYYLQRAHDLLELTGLEGFTESYPKQLSGGMQQRVALCRALLPDPDILLMDEPFGALDEFTREKLNEELLDIWAETEKTILFVTHNIQEAVFLSDRVVVISDRPGNIRAIVDIDLERPRDLAVRENPVFVEQTGEVRKHIDLA